MTCRCRGVDSNLVYLPLDQLPSFGDDWLIYAHVYPDRRTLDWLTARDVRVLTTFRHPCDVLVSLRHYVAWSPANTEDPARSMLAEGNQFEQEASRYVLEYFPNILGISVAWSRLGATVVRYEDLITDPVARLRRLADDLAPLTEERIRKAVLLSQFKRMKAAVDPAAGLQPWMEKHFRRGQVGAWRDEIGGSAVVELMRSRQPFIGYFEAMGYTLDDTPTPPPFSYAAIDPFRNEDCFDNGVPISPVMIRIYLDHDEAERRWPDPIATAGASFYNWLNAPSDRFDGSRDGEVAITNLAASIYRLRSGVQAAYPDPTTADRLAFAWWFMTFGVSEYRLPPEVIAPMQASLARLAPRLPGSRRLPTTTTP